MALYREERLRAENRDLRAQLARKLGAERAAAVIDGFSQSSKVLDEEAPLDQERSPRRSREVTLFRVRDNRRHNTNRLRIGGLPLSLGNA
jgi:hypothetical protein